MSIGRTRHGAGQEFDDEINAHINMLIERFISQGMTREDASRAAHRQFGNRTSLKETRKDMQTVVWLETLWQDLRYGGRILAKNKGFTTVTVLTLALGIGANTAIFSAINAALLRPLPFPDSDRLVRVWSTKNGAFVGSGLSPMDMHDFANTSRSFERFVLYDRWRKNVSGILASRDPEEMVVGLVPGSYFELLGIKPLMGRLFTEEENQKGRTHVAAISNNLWRTRFTADPGILSRTIRINSETYDIVAVMPDMIPAWMEQTSAPILIWTPFAIADDGSEASRGNRGYYTLGRLRPGVSYDQARTELNTLAAGLARDHPMDEGIGASFEPLADTRAGPLRPVLLMLAGAVGLVLVIACSNVAGLLLARNSVRSREMAVRAALGAGRGRLLRQHLVETLLLSLCGGAVGLVLSSVISALLRMNANGSAPFMSSANSLPQFWSTAIELRVLFFSFGISVISALLFGLAPAFTGTHVSLASTLKEGGRGDSTSTGKQRFRQLLVIGEMALSLVLVVAAGLLVQSVIRLQRQNPGFQPDHLLKAHIYLPPARYPDSAAITRFSDEFGDRVRALPGVLNASVTTVYPPSMGWTQMFTIDGQGAVRLADVPTSRFGVVDAHYVTTMGMAIIAGRDFMESDTPTSLPVALVNEELVRRYFPNQNPMGHQIRIGPPPSLLAVLRVDGGSGPRNMTIVGVLRNFMNAGIAQPPDPQFLAPFRQQPSLNYGFKDIVLRTATDPISMTRTVSQQLKALDPDIPLAEVETMADHLSNQTADVRLTTMLLGLFAALGIILSVIGCYGVVSYMVAQRTHDLGVRIALGADSQGILWLVLRQGLSMGLAGVALGVAGAFAVRQFLARLLYGISGTDPWTLGTASLLLLLVVAIASAVPARRAVRIDPIQALRSE